jgi:hypothetical protein
MIADFFGLAPWWAWVMFGPEVLALIGWVVFMAVIGLPMAIIDAVGSRKR